MAITRYVCHCGLATNDTNVAMYHAMILGHTTTVEHPEVPWRVEYACGCWEEKDKEHRCQKHTPLALTRQFIEIC
jgi:hypothetical protein